MAVVPYMPLYVADYLADTTHLSTLEHGAYVLLILAYWQSKAPLPAKNERLANISHLSIEDWRSVRSTLAAFFVEEDGVWRHKRIDHELEHLIRKFETNQKNGRLGGRKPGHKTPNRTVNQTPNRTVNQTAKLNLTEIEANGCGKVGTGTDAVIEIENKPNGLPFANRTVNHTDTDTDTTTEYSGLTEVIPNTHVNGVRAKASDLNGQTSSRFDEFWERYPLQVDKDVACRQFVSVVTIENESEMFSCLDRYLKSDQVDRGVVSKPAKWLQEQKRDGWKSNWPLSKNLPQTESAKDLICRDCNSKPCVCFERHQEAERRRNAARANA